MTIFARLFLLLCVLCASIVNQFFGVSLSNYFRAMLSSRLARIAICTRPAMVNSFDSNKRLHHRDTETLCAGLSPGDNLREAFAGTTTSHPELVEG
jgi:hypothetical protein